MTDMVTQGNMFGSTADSMLALQPLLWYLRAAHVTGVVPTDATAFSTSQSGRLGGRPAMFLPFLPVVPPASATDEPAAAAAAAED
jgi:hypothetical protein